MQVLKFFPSSRDLRFEQDVRPRSAKPVTKPVGTHPAHGCSVCTPARGCAPQGVLVRDLLPHLWGCLKPKILCCHSNSNLEARGTATDVNDSNKLLLLLMLLLPLLVRCYG